jgi:dihydropyrimidinase
VSTYEHVSEIAEYVQKGASSFKFYLGYKGSEKALKRGAVGIDDGLIYASFLEIAKAGPPAIACVHAENEEVIHFFENKIQDKQKMRFIDWANSRPNFSEAESVSRACYLAGNAKSPLYLCHVSAKESLEMVRKMGSTSPLYVETCVHYLTLSKEEGNKREGAVAKVIPPLREKESVEALWRGIDQGWVHTIGTDHIALKKEKKMDVWEGDPGFPGVETLLPLVLTQAMQRNIALQKIARVCSMNPAQIFGLYPTKGTIRPGADADIVIVELEKPYRIKSNRLHSKGDFSPFEGMEVNARVEATWLRGNLVYQAGGELKERMGKKILRNQRGPF